MELRTQTFIANVRHACRQLCDRIASRNAETGALDQDASFRESLISGTIAASMLLELALFSREEYLKFPVVTLAEVMRSLESWTKSPNSTFYFRMDVFGVPVMGLMSTT